MCIEIFKKYPFSNMRESNSNLILATTVECAEKMEESARKVEEQEKRITKAVKEIENASNKIVDMVENLPFIESAEFPGCFYREITVDNFGCDKEWLIAPNIPGVLYRTVKRFANKPVYTLCESFDTMRTNDSFNAYTLMGYSSGVYLKKCDIKVFNMETYKDITDTLEIIKGVSVVDVDTLFIVGFSGNTDKNAIHFTAEMEFICK